MSIATSTAIGIGVAASVGGSIVGGVLAKKGAETQAQAAERAQAEAVAEQRRQFDLNRQDLAPWMTAGTQALQQLQFLMGLGVPQQQAAQIIEQRSPGTLDRLRQMGGDWQRGEWGGGRGGDRFMALDGEPARRDDRPEDGGMDFGGTALTPSSGGGGQPPGAFGSLMRDFGTADFQTDPGYEFRLAEGAKALERSAAARGTVLSGGTQKELARYNQGFASNEFGNAYNRFQSNRATRYNQLAGIAGLGQQTAQTLAGFGQRSAENIGNITIGGMTSAAAARASGYNAWGNIIGNAANTPLNWMLLSRLGGGGLRGCWIAQAVYGAADWRPEVIWQAWTKKWANESRLYRTALGIYLIVGEPVAWFVKRSNLLKRIFRPIFDRLLLKAQQEKLEA